MWTNFFDKIFLVNLAKRTDRLQQAADQLGKYNIPFERIEAVEHTNGAEGLRLTMEYIFRMCIEEQYQNVLIFEDDVDIIEPEINYIMEGMIGNLPPAFDIIYLGCQLCSYSGFYNDYLIQSNCMYATHSAMYSLQGMKKFMGRQIFSPIDNYIVQYIQPDNLCFATYPIICSQIVSHSDIYSDRPVMDWKKWIEQKYWHQINMMKVNGKFPTHLKNYDKYAE